MKITVKNVMEDIVISKIVRISNTFDCCTCDTCLNEIAAYTLNHMPQKYVFTFEDELIIKSVKSTQFDTDMLTHIYHAVNDIKASPRHS